MSDETIQQRIDALPKHHTPMPYKVLLFNRKGDLVGTRYVRASSAERAKLAGYRVDRYIFGNRSAFRAVASPHYWSIERLRKVRPWDVFVTDLAIKRGA